MALGKVDPEVLLDRDSEEREVSVAEQPPEPRLDLQERGREPSMLLAGVLPVATNCEDTVKMRGAERRSKQAGWANPASPRRCPVKAAEDTFGSRGILDLSGYTDRRAYLTADRSWKSCPC